MPKCLFDKTTKLLVGISALDSFIYNPTTHIELDLTVYPDFRTDRWDDGTGIRAATAPELTDYDNGIKDAVASRSLILSGAAILEAVQEIVHEQAKFVVLYNFIKNTALYTTQGQFLTALLSATAFPSSNAAELKQLAKDNFIAKL